MEDGSGPPVVLQETGRDRWRSCNCEDHDASTPALQQLDFPIELALRLALERPALKATYSIIQDSAISVAEDS
jgi:hypothetical protein